MLSLRCQFTNYQIMPTLVQGPSSPSRSTPASLITSRNAAIVGRRVIERQAAAGNVMAHKTGPISGTVNDAGVITLPGDAGKIVIAVSVKKCDLSCEEREKAVAKSRARCAAVVCSCHSPDVAAPSNGWIPIFVRSIAQIPTRLRAFRRRSAAAPARGAASLNGGRNHALRRAGGRCGHPRFGRAASLQDRQFPGRPRSCPDRR